VARALDARVLLRIEDHDRERSRPPFATALLEDLAWLGFRADLGPERQTEPAALTAYDAALASLRDEGRVYGCACSRTTFAASSWMGPGCPGGCRGRGLDGPVLRVTLGDGREDWVDALLGPRSGDVAVAGDLPIRDRRGNWTYGFCVVVDDLRQGIDLVVRGEDLVDATPAQIRLGRILGRAAPARFLHHPLIRRRDGSKLSKSAGDTGVRELRAAGRSAGEVVTMAAAASGWSEPA
jgi:glutamyl/glutaminyl-tRNA synthetase